MRPTITGSGFAKRNTLMFLYLNWSIITSWAGKTNKNPIKNNIKYNKNITKNNLKNKKRTGCCLAKMLRQ